MYCTCEIESILGSVCVVLFWASGEEIWASDKINMFRCFSDTDSTSRRVEYKLCQLVCWQLRFRNSELQVKFGMNARSCNNACGSVRDLKYCQYGDHECEQSNSWEFYIWEVIRKRLSHHPSAVDCCLWTHDILNRSYIWVIAIHYITSLNWSTSFDRISYSPSTYPE